MKDQACSMWNIVTKSRIAYIKVSPPTKKKEIRTDYLSMKKKEFLFQDYLENHVNKCISSLITVRVRPMSSFKMRVSKLQDVDLGHCGFGENSEVFNGIHLCGRSI